MWNWQAGVLSAFGGYLDAIALNLHFQGPGSFEEDGVTSMLLAPCPSLSLAFLSSCISSSSLHIAGSGPHLRSSLQDPELEPMVTRINDLKRMLGVTEGYSRSPSNN